MKAPNFWEFYQDYYIRFFSHPINDRLLMNGCLLVILLLVYQVRPLKMQSYPSFWCSILPICFVLSSSFLLDWSTVLVVHFDFVFVDTHLNTLARFIWVANDERVSRSCAFWATGFSAWVCWSINQSDAPLA